MDGHGRMDRVTAARLDLHSWQQNIAAADLLALLVVELSAANRDDCALWWKPIPSLLCPATKLAWIR
jgi:hypothetical protein